MGVVYEARHVRLNRTCALKMMLAGAYASAEDVARFVTEAEAIARLQHPHIVQIQHIGEAEGLPYFELESGVTTAFRLPSDGACTCFSML